MNGGKRKKSDRSAKQFTMNLPAPLAHLNSAGRPCFAKTIGSSLGFLVLKLGTVDRLHLLAGPETEGLNASYDRGTGISKDCGSEAVCASSLCSTATLQTVRAADTNEVDKLIFRESDNDRKLLEYDKELSVFKDRLHELEISFPPSYPYSEDSSQGKQYMNTRCPAWCDRILLSPSARDLALKCVFDECISGFGRRRLGGPCCQTNREVPVRGLLGKPENEEKSIVYDNIGPNVCMGDHK
ncbi:hypothetical protein FQN60_015258, partial [Etheostoma spectabile]